MTPFPIVPLDLCLLRAVFRFAMKGLGAGLLRPHGLGELNWRLQGLFCLWDSLGSAGEQVASTGVGSAS